MGGALGSAALLLFLLLFNRPIFVIPIKSALSFWTRGNQASDSNWSSQQPRVSEGRFKSGFISVRYCRANQGPVITHLSGGLLHHYRLYREPLPFLPFLTMSDTCPQTGNGQMRIMDLYLMDFPACVITPELPHVDSASVFITLLTLRLKLVFWVLFLSVSRCLKAVQPFFKKILNSNKISVCKSV